MPPRLKAILQYIIILLVTGLLIWFSLRGLAGKEGEDKWQYLADTWHSADKGWLWLMAGIAMISHLVRAERWRMLIGSAGHNASLSNSFLSLMVGYLVNLVIPRGGEVSRCYNLYKLDKTPVEISFGTVVVERVTDVICLLLLVAISFVVESEKLFAFVGTLPLGEGKLSMGRSLLLGGIILVAIALVAMLVIRKNKKLQDFLKKTWLGFRNGLLSIIKLRNKGTFIFYSILIWFLYFVMSYTVIRAFPETGHLGMKAVLSLFAIGSIAMAAPLPGGTGSYHVLVPQGLVFLYNIPLADAVAFTFIFHAWQTAILIAGGALSLVITAVLVRKMSRKGHA